MKKFTKGCLMTALVLFLAGLMLCVVCGVLGGFRQLSQMDGIGSIPFVCGWDDSGHWRIGFFRSPGYDLEELEEIGDIDVGDIDVGDMDVGDMERKLQKLAGKKEQLPLTAETMGSLDIDVEWCDVMILESADEHVWYLADGNISKTHYRIEEEDGGNELVIESQVKHHSSHWGKNRNDALFLWLPKGCALKACEIDVGAGYMKSVSLNAELANISVGAGLLEMDGLAGKEILLSVDAGEFLAGRVTAENTVLQIGAGHLGVEELSASRNANIDVSVGQCEIAGTITGDLDLDCDMGEAVLRLTGSEDDHSFDVNCGMGAATVGSYEHGGFATEQTWNSGKESEFEIDCNMGTVTVTFDE